jgi:hypothetical protein
MESLIRELEEELLQVDYLLSSLNQIDTKNSDDSLVSDQIRVIIGVHPNVWREECASNCLKWFDVTSQEKLTTLFRPEIWKILDHVSSMIEQALHSMLEHCDTPSESNKEPSCLSLVLSTIQLFVDLCPISDELYHDLQRFHNDVLIPMFLIMEQDRQLSEEERNRRIQHLSRVCNLCEEVCLAVQTASTDNHR